MPQLFMEMTQGDSFYDAIGFTDQYDVPIDGPLWTPQIDFKTAFSDTAPLFSLTIDNGLQWLPSGILTLQFDASDVAGIEINPVPRNSELTPSRTIFGDVKLTPPAGTEVVQGDGARTSIFLKIKLGVTA